MGQRIIRDLIDKIRTRDTSSKQKQTHYEKKKASKKIPPSLSSCVIRQLHARVLHRSARFGANILFDAAVIDIAKTSYNWKHISAHLMCLYAYKLIQVKCIGK